MRSNAVLQNMSARTPDPHQPAGDILIMEIFNAFDFGDMTAVYFRQDGIFDLALIPRSMKNDMVPHRRGISQTVAARAFCRARNFEFPALQPESMIQFKIAGTPYSAGHACGSTLRNAPCTRELKFLSQKKTGSGVVTRFRYGDGIVFEHVLEFHDAWARIFTRVRNRTEKDVRFDYLASFSLGMISPFRPDHGPGAYRVFRMQSHWSGEGRLEELSAENAGLEISWQAGAARTLRFGQRSTMPVKDHFPFAAVEDREAGVVWGATLETPGPWEMEIGRFCDAMNLSGGSPEREFNGWSLTLAPGRSFRTMPAVVSCVKGDIQDLCGRLTASQAETASLRAAEKDLPPLFNEFCTTWGRPVEKKLLPQLRALKGMGLKYFVLDAGWFFETPESGAVGDWILNEEQFSGSFDRFLNKIRRAGMIPGIWFEFEVAVSTSLLFRRKPEFFLTLDGAPILNGNRAFLDLRKAKVRTYLRKRVIDFLRVHKIGYMKVDYNACVSLGCDGPDSPVRNLQSYTEAVRSFFDEIRAVLPDLTLEICSSGGHRLSPEWMRFADMGSFSDAHECLEIPIIAADVQSMVLLSKSQVWAVLRASDDEARLRYTLSAAMIGRMCLSGDPADLTPERLEIVREGVRFYREAAPLIADGTSRVIREIGEVRTDPTGWQVFLRLGKKTGYAVVHTFGEPPDEITVPLGGRSTALVRSFASSKLRWSLRNGVLRIAKPAAFQGAAFLFKLR